MTGDPFALATSDGSALLAVADAAGTLRTATYRAGAVSAWTSLGDSGFSGTPAVVSMPGPSLRIFARAAGGQIMTQRQDATDPAVVPFTNQAGQSWLIVFRNVNDTTRVYERRQVPGISASLRRAQSDFAVHSLPVPPSD